MVAPIFTLLIAAGVIFLAYSTSTIETGMENAAPAPAEAPADEEEADEPAEDEPAEEEPAEEEPAEE